MNQSHQWHAFHLTQHEFRFYYFLMLSEEPRFGRVCAGGHVGVCVTFWEMLMRCLLVFKETSGVLMAVDCVFEKEGFVF